MLKYNDINILIQIIKSTCTNKKIEVIISLLRMVLIKNRESTPK